MPNISFIVDKEISIPFILTLPKDDASLYVNVVDDNSGNVLLRMDFKYKDGKAVFGKKIDGVWGKKNQHEMKFNQFNSCNLSISSEKFIAKINDVSYEFENTHDVNGREIRIFSNFDYVTIGSALNSEQHFAQRWPFFLKNETRPWLTSHLSLLQSAIPEKSGLSAIVAYDGNESALTALIQGIHHAADQIIVAIYDASLANNIYFKRIQSRYFNVEFKFPQYIDDDNDNLTDRSYFLNGLIEACLYRNLMLIDSYDDIDDIIGVIKKHRLRTRSDHFAVMGRGEGEATRVIALSLRKSTYLSDGDGCITLPDEDTAIRNIDFIAMTNLNGGLNWSLKVDEKISADGALKHTAAVSVRGYLKSYRPRQRPRIVVMVISCEANRHKQEFIRQTWLNDLKAANIEYVFIEGNPSLEHSVHLGDRIFVNCPDTYEYLSHKVYKAIKAVRETYNPEFVLKTDDDCIYNIQKILEIDLHSYEYIGSNIISGERATYDWHKKSLSNLQLADILYKARRDIRWFDGQGGYFLGRKAMDIIVQTGLEEFSHMFEDYAVGRALHGKVEMPEFVSCHFTSIRDGDIHWDNDYQNTMISDVHSFERMKEIHGLFEKENQRSAGLREGLHVVVSQE